jgi:integrase
LDRGLSFVRSAKSLKDYEGPLRRYVRPGLGAKALASISALDIQTLYGDLLVRSLSARSIRYTHAVLRSALKQATRWNLILANPAANRDAKRRTGENIHQGDPPVIGRVLRV